MPKESSGIHRNPLEQLGLPARRRRFHMQHDGARLRRAPAPPSIPPSHEATAKLNLQSIYIPDVRLAKNGGLYGQGHQRWLRFTSSICWGLSTCPRLRLFGPRLPHQVLPTSGEHGREPRGTKFAFGVRCCKTCLLLECVATLHT